MHLMFYLIQRKPTFQLKKSVIQLKNDFNHLLILVTLASKSLIAHIVVFAIMIPFLIKENSSKLPENAAIIDVFNKQDKLDFPVNYLDLAGCLIPKEQHIHASPNGRRYILRLTEHASAQILD